MAQKYSTLIFDFDGTVADSMGVLFRVYSSLQERFDLRPLTGPDIEKMRGMTPQQVLSFLNISLFKLPRLLLNGRAKYKDFLSDVEPIPGIPYVLIELSKKYQMHVLTSNEQDIVLSFLLEHQLSCFDTVMSERNIFGKDAALKKMLKQLGKRNKEVLYLGDEVRDIHGCQKAGIDVAAVTWGLNTEEILYEAKPTYLIKSPDELLTLL
ncbi:HAD hydrolase-like protein [Candidatus Roizmanbacteria bacterium]|nr:MAG: HAD hydrolase-like protein [Candidatus Roizmanbacteria bacterium]